jgi:AmmeMemoRadiSam system protein B
MRTVMIVLVLVAAASTATAGTIRAQVDSVGFAITASDFEAVLAASLAAEGLAGDFATSAAQPAVAAILPHDDYLYAGRTAVHALPYLQAPRWIVFGVCHACRRVGVRDQLLLDADDQWQVAGTLYTVDTRLREQLATSLGDLASVSPERHHAEHSIEALLPWLGAAIDKPLFVPILVAGMELDRLEIVVAELGGILADICRENGWQPGRDLGLLISADAVHYGCEGWGSSGYAPFGCDEAGHTHALEQEKTIAESLCGPVNRTMVAGFTEKVWDPTHPDYPAYPYKVTWCGLYSIPFGLNTARLLMEDLGEPAPTGRLLRYGDSVSDGKLNLEGTRLGVTAPNTLQHWVGYPTLIYR